MVKNAAEGIEGAEMEGRAAQIKVTLRVDDGMAIIDVEDNGKGFPRENRARLLEPYMTTRTEGTGLGLPIVAKIFEDHGGGIELLDATSGPGAWCACYFPVTGADQQTEGDLRRWRKKLKSKVINHGERYSDC